MEEKARNPPAADGLAFRTRNRTGEAEPPLLLKGLLVVVGSTWIL
jgi:hypothetical protein